MCGIVGLFLKDKSLEPQLGALLSEMLVSMTDRGPDSAGIAIYDGGARGHGKITIQSPIPAADFPGLDVELGNKIGAKVSTLVKSTHAVLDVPTDKLEAARAAIAELRPNARIMGVGEAIEIYKEVGLPAEVVKRFEVIGMKGSHGIGHTRMATESAVTTLGAHPFSTGPDDDCRQTVRHHTLRRRGTRRHAHREGPRRRAGTERHDHGR